MSASVNLAQLFDQLPPGIADIDVRGLNLDSRSLEAGEAFIALAGESSDGKRFLNQAADKGAAVALVDAEPEQRPAALPIVVRPELRREVSEAASRFYGHPSRKLNVVGVTGTNGKTTIACLIAQLLEQAGEACGIIGTLGVGRWNDWRTGINTTPDAISLQRELAHFREASMAWAVMEVSSHGLVQHRVDGVRFKAAAFTNLTPDHLDYHGNLEQYAAAKARLFGLPDLGFAILNADDRASKTMAAQCASTTQQLRYSLTDHGADVTATVLPAGGLLIRSPWGVGDCEFPLAGEFNRSNLLAAITSLAALGRPLDELLAAVPALKAPPGRLQQVHYPGMPRVLIDYAHTPDALSRVLLSLRDETRGRLWCVFGCGGDRDREKRAVMGEVAVSLADRVIVTSDNPRSESPEAIIDDVLEGTGADAAVRAVTDRREAIAQALEEATAEDVVLVAGKGHENTQEIAGRRLPFSDLACVQNWMAQRGAS